MSSTDPILRFAELRPERWRNDGGTTREIACGGNGPGDFAWRLSLADIQRPGAFSLFPGTRRILTVVDGEGLILVVEGREHELERGRPFHFPGGAAVTATLPAGPVRALNAITRCDSVRAQVAVHELTDKRPHPVPAGRFAVLLSGRAVVRTGVVDADLCAYDTVRGADRDTPGITGDGLLVVVRLDPHGGHA